VTYEGGKEPLHDYVQEVLSPLINSKAVGRLTICPILLPRHFSQIASSKHFRGSTFSKMLEAANHEYLDAALTLAPLIADKMSFT